MGYNIGERPTNEILGINLDSYYTLSGPNVTQGQVLIITFVDPVNDSGYIAYLQNIQSIVTSAGSNISAIGILYQFDGALTGPQFLAYKNSLISAGVSFTIVNNAAWDPSAALNYSYNNGITSSPWVYIISKYYLIAAKNTASGDISSVVDGLLAGPSISSIEPTTVDPYNTLSYIGVTFSEAVINAATQTNYTLGGPGLGSIPVNPTNVVLDGTIANKYNLTLGSGTPGTGALSITLTNITDAAFYTPVTVKDTVINYNMDTTPPKVLSARLNPY